MLTLHLTLIYIPNLDKIFNSKELSGVGWWTNQIPNTDVISGSSLRFINLTRVER